MMRVNVCSKKRSETERTRKDQIWWKTGDIERDGKKILELNETAKRYGLDLNYNIVNTVNDWRQTPIVNSVKNFLEVQIFPFLKVVMDASWRPEDVGANLVVSVQSQNFGMMGSGRGAPEAKQDRLGEYWNEERIRQIEQENEMLKKRLEIKNKGR